MNAPLEKSTVRVRDISQANDNTLRIDWTDGFESVFDVVELRKKCPCAVCIDEWTHQPRLDSSTIKSDVRPVRIDSVGRYAMSIKFSDGHGTGIYTFQMLRKLAGLDRAGSEKDQPSLH